MSTKKSQVKKYLIDYLKNRIPGFKMVRGKMKCPFHHLHSNQSEELTANIFPEGSNNLYCFAPECKKLGNIIDLYRKIDLDGNQDISDNEIVDMIIDEFKIKINDDIDKLFDKYENWGWDLVAVDSTNNAKTNFGKASWLEQEWQVKSHKNKNEWESWLDTNRNMGVKTGKLSNVLGLDFDFIDKSLKEKIYAGKGTNEDIKQAKIQWENGLKILKENCPFLDWSTVQQHSFGGVHQFYIYDNEVPKTDFDYAGIHIDIEAEGGQIVIEPSIVGGQNRQIIGETIKPLPKAVKEFILANSKKIKEPEIIKEEVENCELTFENLNNNRNNTFIRLFGEMRKDSTIQVAERHLRMFNNLLDKKLPLKELRAMAREAEKYHKTDINTISEKIIEHFKIVQHEVHFRDLKDLLKIERKDIEEALRYLIDTEKIYKIAKDRYKLLTDVEWQTSFMSLNKPLPWKVPYFDEYARFNDGSLIVLGAKTGVGKCFAKGTKILMYDGSLINVENLRIGDKVMGIDSTARTIINLDNGIDNLYNIIPTKGEKFTVNSRHILSLRKTGTKETLNIGLDEYLTKNKSFQRLYKLYRVPIDFKPQTLIIEPYFLGLWLGDGDSRDSRITKPDQEIHDYLKQYALRLGLDYVEYQYGNKCKSGKIVNHSKNKNKYSLKSLLKKLNLINNKHIPKEYLINSRENRLQLLAGLLDTDGYLASNNYEILIKNKKLSEDIQFLARSLGFLVIHKIKKIKYQNQFLSYHRLSIIGDCSIIPCKIFRKIASKRKINKNPLYTGFKVEKIGIGEYYGFELDGDQLHLIDSFIVNHNTHHAVNIIEQFVNQGVIPKLITTEADSGVGEIALARGLKEGDFLFYQTSDPISVPFQKNEVRIIDWLSAKGDFTQLGYMLEKLNDKLVDYKGLLIVFMQLRRDNCEFFAMNQVDQYASLAAKILYPEKAGVVDNLHPYLDVIKMRRSKTHQKYIQIPLEYIPNTKELRIKK